MGNSTKSDNKVISVLLTIPLLVLALGLFLAMAGLGAWGIVEAINQDPCGNRNLTGLLGCEVQTSLTSQDGEVLSDSPTPWFNWLGASTACGLLWAVVATLAGEALLWTVEEFGKSQSKSSKVKSKGTNSADGDIELQDLGVTEVAPENEPKLEKKTITITGPSGGSQTSKTAFEPTPLRMLTVGGVFGLFFCLFFMALGILSLLWGIATAYGNTRTDNVVLATYVTVEILTAILLPNFFFISGILLAGILDFITWGHLDLRTLIPKFLPVVKFESGVETRDETDDKTRDETGLKKEKEKIEVPYDYWVIEDTFYFEVKKRDHKFKSDKEGKGGAAAGVKGDGGGTKVTRGPDFRDSFDSSLATWSLTFIVCLGIHLPVAYFVDYTLDTQDTLIAPDSCDTIDSTYRCFEALTLEPTACLDTNGTVHCFKFLRFGVDVDIISAASTAFAFFLVASTAFTTLFTIMKILLHIKPTRWWALSYVIVGGLGFLGALVLVGVWASGYVAPLIDEIIHFNVINVAQFFMVSEYLFIVGLLLVAAEWWENVPVPEHKLKVRKELVNAKDSEYGSATRGQVQAEASAHAKETLDTIKAAEAHVNA